jgi:hypothetical protein
VNNHKHIHLQLTPSYLEPEGLQPS